MFFPFLSFGDHLLIRTVWLRDFAAQWSNEEMKQFCKSETKWILVFYGFSDA